MAEDTDVTSLRQGYGLARKARPSTVVSYIQHISVG